MLVRLFILICLACPPSTLLATLLDPESERILEVRLEGGNLIADGIVSYSKETEWYLPLQTLSEKLGIQITVTPSLDGAKGFILDENNPFSLDVTRCTAEVNHRKEAYPCSKVVPWNNELYVSHFLITRWLPLEITPLPYESTVLIRPLKKLPIQLKLEHEMELERSTGLGKLSDPRFYRYTIGRDSLDGFAFDNSLSADYTQRSHTLAIFNQLQMSGETLGWDSYGILRFGSTSSPEPIWLNVARKEPEHSMPLGLSTVELYDHYVTGNSLVSRTHTSRGFLLSSEPLYMPDNFDRVTLAGPLPPGWEVLLYHNEILVARQDKSTSGQYQFTEVPLSYGQNIFRLSFYGPFGEQRNEYRSYSITNEIMRSKKSTYRLGVGQLLSNEIRYHADGATSLHSSLTLRGGSTGNLNDPRQYAYVGFTGFLDHLLYSNQCALSRDGGKACELGLQTGRSGISIGSKYTRLFDFSSDLFNPMGSPLKQTDELNLSLQHALSRIGMRWEVTHKRYEAGEKETELRNLASIGLGRVFFATETFVPLDTGLPWSTQWNSYVTLNPLQYRLGMRFFEKIRLWEGEIKSVENANFSYGLLTRYIPDNTRPDFGISLGKKFKLCHASFQALAAELEYLSFGLLLNISGAFEPREQSIEFRDSGVATSAMASVFVFLDRNENGKFDPEDEPLPQVRLEVNHQELPTETNGAGIALLTHLRPYYPTNISVSPKSLEQNPFLKPFPRGVRAWLRPGKPSEINLPVVFRGEVDGTLLKDGKPIRNAEVELVDKKRLWVTYTLTDAEGFYFFPEVPPGSYSLQLSKRSQKVLGPWKGQAFQEVSIQKRGSFESGVVLNLVTQNPTRKIAGAPKFKKKKKPAMKFHRELSN